MIVAAITLSNLLDKSTKNYAVGDDDIYAAVGDKASSGSTKVSYDVTNDVAVIYDEAEKE